MAKEKTRLNFDLSSLLPGESFKIGDNSIIIKPLGLRQIKEITKVIGSLFSALSGKGVRFSNTIQEITDPEDSTKTVKYITPPNYKEPEMLLAIAQVLILQFPGVLSEVSGIHEDDLDEFPIELLVELVDKCIDVNLKSKESLLGNLKSLTGKLEKLGLIDKKVPENQSKEEKDPQKM